jgi:hypothetical protein
MPKKTPETETVDTMDLELSTSEQNVDTTDSMTRMNPWKTYLTCSIRRFFHDLKPKKRRIRQATASKALKLSLLSYNRNRRRRLTFSQAPVDASEILATRAVLQEAPNPSQKGPKEHDKGRT